MQLNICSPRLIQSVFIIKFLRKLKIPFIRLPANVEKFTSIPSTSILFTNSASLLPLLLKLIVCSNSAAVLKTPLIPSENVVAILLKSPDWAERLKEAIKSGNWYDVGEVLAKRINAIFDSIDWENTEKKVTDRVNKILDLINGFADNLDFQHLGNTFAGELNTISSPVNAFSDNIHWETIGSGLANGMNQAVNKIEWEQLGRSMSLNIRILTNLFYNFVTEFDWINLCKNISKAVNGWFNGGNLGSDISRLLKSIPEFSSLFSDSSELSERIFISSIPASDRFTFLAVSVAILPVFLSFCVASAACL